MSVVQPAPIDRGASPLMSNNPFRNRVASTSPTDSQTRPISTNPFLDSTELNKVATPTTTTVSKPDASSDKDTNKTTELFSKMNVNSIPKSPERAPPRVPKEGARRPENMPPRPQQRPSTSHRPANPEDEERRRRMKQRAELDIFADPPDAAKLRERRPRRNSESSVRDKTSQTLSPEEEKKRRERKHRESKRVGSTTKSGKPNRRLDVIDKLDVTSIYGTGLFHHDGPFDACNPHRNRKKEKFAPMQAFPKDSTNMIVGGSGPVNAKLDYDRFHGYGQEAHRDFNEAALADDDAPAEDARRPRTTRHGSYNPTAREYIHGDETVGLGTSTFLEGAPASRAAIQRRESEYETSQIGREGVQNLSRKKSLAQKIRGVRTVRDKVTSPGVQSPPQSPLPSAMSEKVTGYFDGLDKDADKKDGEPKEVDKKDASSDQEEQPTDRPRAPSSPIRNPLERRNTTDAPAEEQNKSSSGGFLGRMKSLKAGAKPRPTRRDTSN